MAVNLLTSPDIIRQFLRYEADTGRLFWQKDVPVELFGSRRAANIWHTKYSGKEAFTAHQSGGYRTGAIRGKNYLAHRVIASILYGDIGGQYVDHINGVRDDNRSHNLRLTTHSENLRNSSLWSHNTSGHVGVVWHKNNKKWGARIKVDGRDIHIGLFKTKEEAINARKAAEREFGFHPNHGLTSEQRKLSP